MPQAKRPVIITGNWKMYKTVNEAVTFVKALIPLVAKAAEKAYLAVPFTDIKPVAELIKETNIVVGAQNMHDASEGSFTGEIAAKMLKEAGAHFVIIGHSERRRYFHETNEFINKKVKRALEEGLQPVLCVGETKNERHEHKTEEVLKTQLEACLANVTDKNAAEIIIAYEPVWAIGTDDTASPELAQEAHAFCRQCLSDLFGKKIAQQIVIQYGGSVKPENAKELLDQPDIDGLLVGGASLSAEKFSKIVMLPQE